MTFCYSNCTPLFNPSTADTEKNRVQVVQLPVDLGENSGDCKQVIIDSESFLLPWMPQ
jgi:hypothetical protein